MAEPTFAVVVTTIHDGAFLDVYAKKLAEEGLLDRATMVVIPDRKTPPTLTDAVARARRAGLAVDCPDLDAQDAFLRSLGRVHDIIPWDSETRRNVGSLLAYASGADVIVAIDDDNLCELPGPWLGEHAVVAGPPSPADLVGSPTGWLNPCGLLALSRSPVYPRGYPFAQRGADAPWETRHTDRVRIDVNAGLWLDDPDIDAFTRLAGPVTSNAVQGESIVLDPATWSPINTQNTAVRRAALPAWWCVRMGDAIDGLRIERFGDILGGYLLLACARAAGGHVRFGTPPVMHRRNVHDIGRDALLELPGVWLVESLAPWLRAVTLEATGYDEAYPELADALDGWAETARGPAWTTSARAFTHGVADGMRAWAEAFRVLDGRGR